MGNTATKPTPVPASTTLPVIFTTVRYVIIASNYQGSENQLYGCVKDAENFQKFLLSKYPQAIGLMINDKDAQDIVSSATDPLARYPCQANILKAMSWLYSNTSVENYPKVPAFAASNNSDCLHILYFSGHGSQILDRNRDESDGLDEVICPIEYDRTISKLITDDQLSTLFKLRANNLTLVVTDCCNSGSNLDLPLTFKNDKPVSVGKYPTTAGPIIHIAGCRDNEYSYEDASGGYLSSALIKVLTTNQQPELSILMSKVSNLVKKASNSAQTPQMSIGNNMSPYYRYPL